MTTSVRLPRLPDRPTVTVLGGSTPFVSDLFAALAGSPEAGRPADLRLVGRDRAALEAVAAHASALLGPVGWRVTTATSVAAGVDGADVVVHQVRYGGLAARAADERVAHAVGLPGDETLGPAGLRAAVRIRADIDATARALVGGCPDAVVLNLTNPLSVTTHLLTTAGLPHVIGLCELPELAARQVAGILGDPGDGPVDGSVDGRVDGRVGGRAGEPGWRYSGLNHRGFVHGLGDGLDLLAARLTDRPAEQALAGVRPSDLTSLRAVPMKYHAVMRGRHDGAPGRATFLQDLRERALAELTARPDRRPPALAERPQPWYACSVVPVLASLRGGSGHHVVNRLEDDGLVHERRVTVAEGRLERHVDVPPDELRDTLLGYETHERRILAAVAEPTLATLTAACAADPMVPSALVEPAAQRLLASLEAADPKAHTE